MSGGPGQLILATAGAIVGGIYGGPAGAALGWSLGMAAGGIIWPADPGSSTGPRLLDRTVQTSSYGVPIPHVWGNYRLAGNAIYAQEIYEAVTTKRVGKSLFSKGQKQTTYSYYGTVGIAVCRGPIPAFGRVWADGKLIYDPNVRGKFDKFFTFYLGSETQLPDPTIEADKGAGQVPAFRGLAYVMIGKGGAGGIPLADFGNRIPNFLIEVGGQPLTALWRDGTITNTQQAAWTYQPAWPTRLANTWSSYVTVVDTYALTAIQWQPASYSTFYTTYSGGDPTTTITYPLLDTATAMFGDIYGPALTSTNYARPAIDPISGDIIVFLQGVTSKSMIARFSISSGAPVMIYNRAFSTVFAVGQNWVFANKIFMVDQFQDWTYCFDIATGAEDWRHDHSADIPTSIYGPISSATCRVSDGSIYWTYRNSSLDFTNFTLAGVVRQSLTTGAILASRTGVLGSYANFAAVYDTTTDSVILVTEEGFTRLDPVTLATVATYPMATPWQTDFSQLENEGANNAVAGSIWLTNGTSTFYQVSTSDFSTLWSGTIDTAVSGVPTGVDMGEPIHIAGPAPTFFGSAYGASVYRFSNTGSAVTLDTVVGGICADCEMVAGDYDVTELSAQAVQGYCVGKQSTGRAAIEPLMSAYTLDAPERDGKLYFQYRKTASVATIDDDDLGATSDGNPKDRMTETRRQEIELPLSVTVQYTSAALDYQVATQSMKRISVAVEAGDPTTTEYPLVLTDAEAKAVAARVLFLTWVERTSYQFALPPRFVALDPGDVVDVPAGDGYARVLLRRVEYGGDGVVQLEGVQTDQLAYAPPPDLPSVPIIPAQTVPTVETMTPVLVDAPLLSDADDSFGYYAGGYGTTAAWRGGEVYTSLDGSSYEAGGTVTVASPKGAGGVLASHTSAYIDRTNVLRVVWPYAVALESITELQLLAGGNRLMLGAELLGFATATQISPSTWDLSTLLRAQQGTEWASTHAAGDVAILIENLESVFPPISEIDLDRYFKAVSTGDYIDDATATIFAGAGVRLKPLSPVHIEGTRDGSDNLSLTWVRRARLDGDWRDYVETPLDEPVELYEVDVLVAGVVVATLSASTPAATFSAAEQTAVGITPGASISVKIYQLSSRVGRGYPGSATV